MCSHPQLLITCSPIGTSGGGCFCLLGNSRPASVWPNQLVSLPSGESYHIFSKEVWISSQFALLWRYSSTLGNHIRVSFYLIVTIKHCHKQYFTLNFLHLIYAWFWSPASVQTYFKVVPLSSGFHSFGGEVGWIMAPLNVICFSVTEFKIWSWLFRMLTVLSPGVFLCAYLV